MSVPNIMLQTGIAALEHARDLRVKVGVSDLQAIALLDERRELLRLLGVSMHPINCNRWACMADGDDYDEGDACDCEVGAFIERTPK